jgi:hypothetical protein
VVSRNSNHFDIDEVDNQNSGNEEGHGPHGPRGHGPHGPLGSNVGATSKEILDGEGARQSRSSHHSSKDSALGSAESNIARTGSLGGKL